jgi:hypothetical protein
VDRCLAIAKLTDLKPYLEGCTASYKEEEQKLSDYDFANIYGIKPSKLEALVDRLLNGFSWAEWQARFNDMGEHGIVTVTGIEDEPTLQVHYVYKKSEVQDAPTVLLCHG